MENYIEEPLVFHTADPDPFEGINFKKIQITETKTVNKIVQSGRKALLDGKAVVLSAIGRDSSKAVTCAEILKSKFFTKSGLLIHQLTFINKIT